MLKVNKQKKKKQLNRSHGIYDPSSISKMNYYVGYLFSP